MRRIPLLCTLLLSAPVWGQGQDSLEDSPEIQATEAGEGERQVAEEIAKAAGARVEAVHHVRLPDATEPLAGQSLEHQLLGEVTFGFEIRRRKGSRRQLQKFISEAEKKGGVARLDPNVPGMATSIRGAGASVGRLAAIERACGQKSDLPESLGERFGAKGSPYSHWGGSPSRLAYLSLRIRLLAFAEADHAAAFVRMNTRASHDPSDPKIVVSTTGYALTDDMHADLVEAVGKGGGLPGAEVLAGYGLGPELDRSKHDADDPDHKRTAYVPEAPPPFDGLRIRFTNGVTLWNVRFDTPKIARHFIERKLWSEDQVKVADQRGRDVSLLTGAPLSNVDVAIKHLSANWNALRPDGKRTMIACLFGDTRYGGVTFVPGGPFYNAGANILRAGRQHSKPGATKGENGMIAWKFADEHRNRVRFKGKGDPLFGEAIVSPRHMQVVMSKDLERFRSDHAYLMALLGGLNVRLPAPSRSMIELVESE